MYRILLLFLTILLICGLNSVDAQLELGFLRLGDLGDFTKPSLEFAKDTFSTTELGKADINSATFKKYAVVWWNDGDSDPGVLSNAQLDAILDYVETGGAFLLTGKAFSYATPLGLEDAQPRAFGPIVDDGSNVGITVIQETIDSGLIEGLKNVDGKDPAVNDRIQLNSTGFPKSGDYFDKLWKNFTTMAHAWERAANYTDRIAAFGYWKAGNGKVFNLNWRLPNYHKNNQSIDNLHQVTENIINWLASESEYLDVSSYGKLPVVWGKLKNER